MNPKEQEIAINELEERVDRLRNIYEQYFLGFEKLEPAVPKKDVERRFVLLRKEQIRNTALRFRFQVVTQKYNTYSMHWTRICRQIEEGTYKRHVRKAKARFGDPARAPERDVSIDIDIADFDDADMDAVLAEADAAAAAYERHVPDTLPPAAPAMSQAQQRAAAARQMLLTPGTSFAVAGRREMLDESEPSTPLPSVRPMPDRAGRGAALPPGAKPRILRKRDDSEPPSAPDLRAPPAHAAAGAPPSQRMLPGAPVPPPSQRMVPGAPVPPPSQRMVPNAPVPPPSQRMLPGAPVPAPMAASSPRMPVRPAADLNIPGGRPAGPRIVRSGGVPESVPGMPNAPPAGASSAGRMPAATPSAGAPAAGRIPVAPPAASSSAGRIPVAPPFAPAARPPPSANRLPVPGAGAPAPSQARVPAAPPAQGTPGWPSAPGAPGARPPPQSVPRIPPTSSPRPVPNARPQTPSAADMDTTPPPADARPSVRPRVPLPLPSQAVRPTKKE